VTDTSKGNWYSGRLPAPNRFIRYPRLNPHTFRAQLERLEERWDEEIYGEALGLALAVDFHFTFVYPNRDQPHFSVDDLVRVEKFFLGGR
jgi:hypothetical protein